MADPKGPESGEASKGGHSARPRSTLDLSATDVTPKAQAKASEKASEKEPADPAGAGSKPDAASATTGAGLGAAAPADGAKPSGSALSEQRPSETKPSETGPRAPESSAAESSAAKSSAAESSASGSSGAANPAATDPRPSVQASAASAASTAGAVEPEPRAPGAGGASGLRDASVPPLVAEAPRSEGVGVVGVIAAAVAGAAIAVLAVALFGKHLIDAPEPDMRRVAAAEGKLDTVGRDVAGLNQRVGALAQSSDTSAIGAKLGELDGRLAELGKSIETAAGRSGAVESELQILSAKVDDPRPDPAVGVIAGRVEGLELKTQTLPTGEAFAVLASRLENVERRALEAAGKSDLVALNARVEGVGRTVEEATKPLADRVAQLAAAVEARPKGDPAARLVVALGALDAALATGRPFAAELAAVTASAGGNAELQGLDKSAAAGLAPRAALGAEVGTILAGLPPLKEQATGSVFDRFVANAGGVVKITPQDAAPGSDPAGLRARVAALGSAGDLEQALALRGKLDPAARAATDDWANQATARVAAETAVAAARAAALARLAVND